VKKYLIILAGSLMLATTAAMAAPSPQDHDRGGDHHGRSDHRDHDGRDHDRRDDRHGRNDYRHDRRDYGHYDNRRGYGYGHGRSYYVVHDRGPRGGWYRRGGYVPVQYRETRYVVNDWRSERLREPPRGYRWIRGDDNQFLLVAITSGVIADILLSH
jgi:Ni/Co efflux regulator RcnB